MRPWLGRSAVDLNFTLLLLLLWEKQALKEATQSMKLVYLDAVPLQHHQSPFKRPRDDMSSCCAEQRMRQRCDDSPKALEEAGSKSPVHIEKKVV